MWYGLCAVVGAAASWVGSALLSFAVIAALVVFGLILANTKEQAGSLPIHHSIIGLAVTLALSHALPLAILAL